MSVDKELDKEFTSEEIAQTLGKKASGKAPGEDGISIEFIKAIPKEKRENLRSTMNKCWNEGIIPEGWKKARIVPTYKSGDKEKASNYRGISLLDPGYKLLTAMMAERLNKWIEKEKVLRES